MTPAEVEVRRLIAERGPVGFDLVMELALYDPEVGFYSTGGRAGGRSGDFMTSPETGPLFGMLLGRYLDRVWRELDEPEPFTFVDVGAGPGTLARTLVASEPDCSAALRTVCVEASATQRSLHSDAVESRAELPEEPVTGVIMANELLDNMPFRIVECNGEGWVELLVGLEDDRLSTQLGPIVDVDLPALPTGTRLPLVDRAAAWVEVALRRVNRGRLVVIDFGASSSELAERGQAWLRTYRDQRRGTDPLDLLGEQDITCDVPFDQLPAPDLEVTQAEWLTGLGIGELVEEGRRVWSDLAAAGGLEALAARSRIAEAEALTDPAGLGGFSVFEWHS